MSVLGPAFSVGLPTILYITIVSLLVLLLVVRAVFCSPWARNIWEAPGLTKGFSSNIIPNSPKKNFVSIILYKAEVVNNLEAIILLKCSIGIDYYLLAFWFVFNN